MTYIYRWGDYLLSKSKAEIMRTQMGWTPDRKAFVVGDKEIDVNFIKFLRPEKKFKNLKE